MDAISRFIKVFIIILLTYFTTRKIMNKNKTKDEKFITILLTNIVIAIVYYFLRNEIGLVSITAVLITLLSSVISKTTNKGIGYTVVCTSISLAINNVLFILSSLIIYIPGRLLKIITNEYIIMLSISLVYSILVYLFLKVKKIKNGFDFFNANAGNEYFETLFINISAVILFSVIWIINYDIERSSDSLVGVIIFICIMFATIKKSFNLHYKQKLLTKELEETKAELAKKEKEIEDLEAENIAISKKSHTLAHKQKSLEYRLEEILSKTEISKDEVGEVRDRIKAVEKDLYTEKTTIELDKTEIPQIDDMLKYMQSECKKNKIDFELQVKGNIHYMINNLITKEDLETLLADHIKNAIIAINHTENVNRSILVRLGEIDGIYSLYIYDTGIEFEKETLENLGKKPSTTHKDEGGTGMGFMNTFDTLRKCNASLIIEQIGKPSKDNYTKAIIIKFDKNNEFKIM